MNYAKDLTAIANGDDLSDELEQFAEDVATSCFHSFGIGNGDLLADMMQEARVAIVGLSEEDYGAQVGGGLLRERIYSRLVDWVRRDGRQRQAYGWSESQLEDYHAHNGDGLAGAYAEYADDGGNWAADNAWDDVVGAYEGDG